jgi:hypothetical protein
MFDDYAKIDVFVFSFDTFGYLFALSLSKGT